MNFLEKVLPCQIWRDDYHFGVCPGNLILLVLVLQHRPGHPGLLVVMGPMLEALAFWHLFSYLCAVLLIFLCKEVARS